MMDAMGNLPEALEISMRDANAASRPFPGGAPLARWMAASMMLFGGLPERVARAVDHLLMQRMQQERPPRGEPRPRS